MEDAYNKKFAGMQKYILFLEELIKECTDNSNPDPSQHTQLIYLIHLHQKLTDHKKLKIKTLKKYKKVLKKIKHEYYEGNAISLPDSKNDHKTTQKVKTAAKVRATSSEDDSQVDTIKGTESENIVGSSLSPDDDSRIDNISGNLELRQNEVQSPAEENYRHTSDWLDTSESEEEKQNVHNYSRASSSSESSTRRPEKTTFYSSATVYVPTLEGSRRVKSYVEKKLHHYNMLIFDNKLVDSPVSDPKPIEPVAETIHYIDSSPREASSVPSPSSPVPSVTESIKFLSSLEGAQVPELDSSMSALNRFLAQPPLSTADLEQLLTETSGKEDEEMKNTTNNESEGFKDQNNDAENEDSKSKDEEDRRKKVEENQGSNAFFQTDASPNSTMNTSANLNQISSLSEVSTVTQVTTSSNLNPTNMPLVQYPLYWNYGVDQWTNANWSNVNSTMTSDFFANQWNYGVDANKWTNANWSGVNSTIASNLWDNRNVTATTSPGIPAPMPCPAPIFDPLPCPAPLANPVPKIDLSHIGNHYNNSMGTVSKTKVHKYHQKPEAQQRSLDGNIGITNKNSSKLNIKPKEIYDMLNASWGISSSAKDNKNNDGSPCDSQKSVNQDSKNPSNRDPRIRSTRPSSSTSIKLQRPQKDSDQNKSTAKVIPSNTFKKSAKSDDSRKVNSSRVKSNSRTSMDFKKKHPKQAIFRKKENLKANLEEMRSPLLNLHDTDIPNSGPGYGLQNFKIPKKKRPETPPPPPIEESNCDNWDEDDHQPEIVSKNWDADDHQPEIVSENWDADDHQPEIVPENKTAEENKKQVAEKKTTEIKFEDIDAIIEARFEQFLKERKKKKTKKNVSNISSTSSSDWSEEEMSLAERLGKMKTPLKDSRENDKQGEKDKVSKKKDTSEECKKKKGKKKSQRKLTETANEEIVKPFVIENETVESEVLESRNEEIQISNVPKEATSEKDLEVPTNVKIKKKKQSRRYCRDLDNLHKDIRESMAFKGVRGPMGERRCRLSKTGENINYATNDSLEEVESVVKKTKKFRERRSKQAKEETEDAMESSAARKEPGVLFEKADSTTKHTESPLFENSSEDENCVLDINKLIAAVDSSSCEKKCDSWKSSCNTEQGSLLAEESDASAAKQMKRKRKDNEQEEIPKKRKKTENSLDEENKTLKINSMEVDVSAENIKMKEDQEEDIDLQKLLKYIWTGEKRYHCLFCNFLGKKIVHHYVLFHPREEVMISRFSVEEAQVAIKESKTLGFHEDLGTNRKFNCRFCMSSVDAGKANSVKLFFEHCTIHTGEYMFQCTDCSFKANVKSTFLSHRYMNRCHNSRGDEKTGVQAIRKMQIPNDKLVYGYLCSRCNFVQLQKKNVEEHVQKKHANEEGVEVVKINMSLKLKSQSLDSNATPVFEKKKVKKKKIVPAEDSLRKLKNCDSLEKNTEALVEKLQVETVYEDGKLKKNLDAFEGSLGQENRQAHSGEEKKTQEVNGEDVSNRWEFIENEEVRVESTEMKWIPKMKIKKVDLVKEQRSVETGSESSDSDSDYEDSSMDVHSEPEEMEIDKVTEPLKLRGNEETEIEPAGLKSPSTMEVLLSEKSTENSDGAKEENCMKDSVGKTKESDSNIESLTGKLMTAQRLSAELALKAMGNESNSVELVRVERQNMARKKKIVKTGIRFSGIPFIDVDESVPEEEIKLKKLDGAENDKFLCEKLTSPGDAEKMETSGEKPEKSSTACHSDDLVQPEISAKVGSSTDLHMEPAFFNKQSGFADNLANETTNTETPSIIRERNAEFPNQQTLALSAADSSLSSQLINPNNAERTSPPVKKSEESLIMSSCSDEIKSEPPGETSTNFVGSSTDLVKSAIKKEFDLGKNIATNKKLMERGNEKQNFCNFQCCYCVYEAVSKVYVDVHQSLMHPEMEKKSLQKTPYSVMLPKPQISRRNQVLPYVCKKGCNKLFFIPMAFESHLKKHVDITMYRCHVCKAMFPTITDLITHYNCHEIGQYQCVYCIFGAATLSEIRVHLCIQHCDKLPMVLERKLPSQPIRTISAREQLLILNLEDYSL